MKTKLNINLSEEKNTGLNTKRSKVNGFLRNSGSVQSLGIIFVV